MQTTETTEKSGAVPSLEEIRGFGASLESKPGHCARTWQSCDWQTAEGREIMHERSYWPHNVFKAVSVHYWIGLYTDHALAQSDAKQYGAVVEKDFYCDDENPSWFLIFNDWDKACAYAMAHL